MDEFELIEAAKIGDSSALTTLVKKYSNTIYNFAYKVCRDKEKAQNTMQDTFLSMVKSISQFNSKAKLSTWLYRIVANHCMMAARKQKDAYFVEVETEDSLKEAGGLRVKTSSRQSNWQAISRIPDCLYPPGCRTVVN